MKTGPQLCHPDPLLQPLRIGSAVLYRPTACLAPLRCTPAKTPQCPLLLLSGAANLITVVFFFLTFYWQRISAFRVRACQVRAASLPVVLWHKLVNKGLFPALFSPQVLKDGGRTNAVVASSSSRTARSLAPFLFVIVLQQKHTHRNVSIWKEENAGETSGKCLYCRNMKFRQKISQIQSRFNPHFTELSFRNWLKSFVCMLW